MPQLSLLMTMIRSTQMMDSSGNQISITMLYWPLGRLCAPTVLDRRG